MTVIIHSHTSSFNPCFQLRELRSEAVNDAKWAKVQAMAKDPKFKDAISKIKRTAQSVSIICYPDLPRIVYSRLGSYLRVEFTDDGLMYDVKNRDRGKHDGFERYAQPYEVNGILYRADPYDPPGVWTHSDGTKWTHNFDKLP